MASAAPRSCRVERCAGEIPPALAAEGLCVDHFLDASFTRADFALEKCHLGEPIDRATIDWLLADANLTLNALTETAQERDLEQQGRILELLLCVANLNEYISHHSFRAPAQAEQLP